MRNTTLPPHTRHALLRRWRHHALAHALQCLLWSAAAGTTLLPATSAHAQAAESRQYDIPPGSLTETLKRFGVESGLLLSFSTELTASHQSPGLRGLYTTDAALRELLRQTGLEALPQSGSGYLLRRAPSSGDTQLAPVNVNARIDGENAWGPVDGYLATRSATATKTDTPINETPQSISVVTADLIRATGAIRLSDTLAYTAGVTLPTTDSRSEIFGMRLRGFDAYTPGYYLDGLQLRNNNTWGIWRTETYATERVEVLKGPSSVLYGQNGPGGMINVVSKRPTNTPQHEVQLQTGSDEHHQLATDLSGPLDTDGKLRYRLVAVLREAELPVGGMDDDRQFIAPSFSWHPSSDTSLTFLTHYLRDRGGVYTRWWPLAGSLITTPAGHISSTAVLGDPDFHRMNQDQWAMGYALEHRFNDTWRAKQNLRYIRMDTDYRQIMTGGFMTVDNSNADNPDNYRYVNRSVFGSKENALALTVDNQLQANWKGSKWEHTVLMGLDYQRTRYDQRTFWGSAPTLDLLAPVYGQAITVPAPYLDARTQLVQTGLYLQDQLKFNERWVATLGGRYDRARIETDNNLNGSKTRQSDQHFTGRAGLVYLHASGLSPYLSYAESFSPITTLNPATGQPFDPETGRQYEIGTRYQPLGSKDSYSLAVFDLKRQNYVTYNASSTPRQVGEVLVRGMELEAKLAPTSRLNLVAAYTWTPQSRITKSNNPNEIGKPLFANPRHQFSLWGDYRFPWGLKFGLGARYHGANQGDGNTAPVEIDSYTLVDAMIGYDTGPWSLALNVRNLGNENYIATCDTSGNCYYGDLRKVVATASYRW